MYGDEGEAGTPRAAALMLSNELCRVADGAAMYEQDGDSK